MNINIKATNIELTSAIKNYVEKKIGGLEKFVDANTQAFVEIGKTTKHHRTGNVYRAEVQMQIPGRDSVRVEVNNNDLYAAIDIARVETKEKLVQTKEKRKSLIRQGAKFIKKIIPFLNGEK